MTRALRWLPLVALIHCGGDDGAAPTTTATDGGAPDSNGEATADAGDSPYGFDERPANATCLAPKRPRPPSASGVTLERVYPNIVTDRPVVLTKRVGVPRWYVVEQPGRIVSFDDVPNVATTQVVLDLRAKVDTQAYESGLLGLAFHPKFATNGYAYVYYAHDGGTPSEGVRVARFTSTDGGITLDPTTEKTILEVHRGIQNHLGGNVLFGPDGYLYVGLGDATDSASAQLLDGACDGEGCRVFGGKILRLDVDGGDPYAIPSGNPLAKGGGRGEIFAWGFRNPWRWTFDRATGALWLADVGESRREEIDLVQGGGNYGWPVHEGSLCDADCLPEHVPPLFDVAHPTSHSITGGFVYRGAALPRLRGSYVFGDFVLNKVWALVTDATTGARSMVTLNANGPAIYNSSFAETDAGEIVAVDWGGGSFWQLVADGPPAPPESFPTKLSETGCVDPKAPHELAEGVIPYSVNVPFWSDGATKERAFAIPDGTRISVRSDGDLDLPIGSVTMKTFLVGGKRIETRLFVRHEDGDWGGYTYEWDDAEQDAVLLADAKVKRVGTQDWELPSRVDCMRCHSAGAGRTLGLEAAQLERRSDYPGRPARDQLDTLVHAGFFDAPVPRGAALPEADGAAPVEARARAYLHASCSNCHRPAGGSTSLLDLRFATPLAAMNACDVAPTRGGMGITNARLLAPSDPARSLLVRRPKALDVWRMPPIASHVVDVQGTDLVAAWIAGTASCP